VLVCNVSAGRAARAIATGLAEQVTTVDRPDGHVGVRAAELTEQVTATDTPDIEHVVFDTLVDDPASANEILDASLGSLLMEAANASDTVDLAGATYAAPIDEAMTAGSAEDATVIAAVVGRSAMLPGVFVNPGTSREANVIGTMVNL
jgi:hypothetical protein